MDAISLCLRATEIIVFCISNSAFIAHFSAFGLLVHLFWTLKQFSWTLSKYCGGSRSRWDGEVALARYCFGPKNMASGPLGNANSPIGNKAINPTSPDGSGIQQLRRASTSQITPAELTRPSNIQRILQKKAQVKAYPRLKKLEKLGVYSSCKVSIVWLLVVMIW